jgi:hypothetical protein
MSQTVNIVQTDQKTQLSKFRKWVQDIWFENCEERQIYNQDQLKIQEYWSKYKWWLKHEYRQRHRL